MKHTLTEAKAELKALKACSRDEMAVNYHNWKDSYIERLQSTTGKTREIYSKCLDILLEAELEPGEYEDDIWDTW